MKAKIEYNPEEPSGLLYYMESDTMLMFPYEYYKKDVLMINIPVEFDESFRKRREEILNFIGNEVVMRQPKPSYYKITETSIIILKITTAYHLKLWPVQGLLAILLLTVGLYMTSKGIVLGKELGHTPFHRRSLVPISGPLVIITAIIWLISVYFKRKSTLK
jgi:hypothetical protein